MQLAETRIANLENLRKTGTVVLSMEDSREDIFNKEYQQALAAINSIVQKNMADFQPQVPTRRSDYHNPCEDPCVDSATFHNIAFHRTHTLISFIGNRGTGKTSVMLTVLRRLQTLRLCKEMEPSLKPLSSSSFICLEPIDAGILQSGEDIIEIVLARMFNYLQQVTNGNNLRAQYQEELRSLYREFDKLYQNLCRLRKGGHFLEGESALRELQNLASSHSTAREFKDLVWHLLTYIKILNGCKKNQYLVVALDDIDMYGEGRSQNCYTLLEEIFDYLSIPGIIVLATYNETLLKKNCSNHLREKFFENRKSSECSSTERTEVKNLVQQFLEKLIIEEYRIYMPMLARVDVSNQVGMSVRLDKSKDPELCSMFGDGNEIVVPVKTFLLRLIANRTNVYFDSRGKKRHFFEPYNLRDLSVFWRLLEALDNPANKGNSDQERTYANNRSKLFSYTMNPFASEKLEEGEGEYLYKLSQQPLERQERVLIDDIKRRWQSQESQKEKRAFLEGRWQHSYGELLHCLYYATRLQHNGMSKELIYCILSNYSLILNQLYYASDFKTGGESRKTFSQFVGTSIAGGWANDMLPKLRINLGLLKPTFFPLGAATLATQVFFGWEIDSDTIHALFNFSQNGKLGSTAERNRKVKAFVQAIELLGMFFTHVPEEGFKLTLEREIEEEKNEYVYFLESTQTQEIFFNALNFVVNSIDLSAYFDIITKTITEMFRQFVITWGISIYKGFYSLEQNSQTPRHIEKVNDINDPTHIQAQKIALENEMKMYRQMVGTNVYDPLPVLDTLSKEQIVKIIRQDADTVAKKVMHTVQRYSLRNEFELWAEENLLPLPLQNFDMMYNIIKRLANTNYYGRSIPESVEEGEVFNAFKQLYESIGQQLEEQDSFYRSKEKNERSSFSAIYRGCPFYKHFVESPSTQLIRIFTEVINAMTRGQEKANPAQI